MVPPEGTGISPHPSLSLCHLCFAVTDRQAPAHRTINYSRAPFLHIDVKSKFPARPLPAFQMRFSHHRDPSCCRAIGHATTSGVRRDPHCHQHVPRHWLWGQQKPPPHMTRVARAGDLPSRPPCCQGTDQGWHIPPWRGAGRVAGSWNAGTCLMEMKGACSPPLFVTRLICK